MKQELTSLVQFVLHNNMAFYTMVIWCVAGSIALAIGIMMTIRVMLSKTRRVYVPVHLWHCDTTIYTLDQYIQWMSIIAVMIYIVGWWFAVKI